MYHVLCFVTFIELYIIFRLDALALSVIATATWLAGWLSVTAGIVSKRLNLPENFLDAGRPIT